MGVTLKISVLAISILSVQTGVQGTTIESAADFRPVRPEDDKRSASDDRQVTKRSAECVPPKPRGLRGRGGERPFSDCDPRGARLIRGNGSEMNAGKYASRLFGPGEQILTFEKRHPISRGARNCSWMAASRKCRPLIG
jgi:hypothetical protein